MTLSSDRIKKIRPLYDRVLIERVVNQENKTPGGILIPDQAKERPQIGKILAVGDGKILQNGSVQALTVKVGEHVFFGKFAGTEVGEECVILREEEILGII